MHTLTQTLRPHRTPAGSRSPKRIGRVVMPADPAAPSMEPPLEPDEPSEPDEIELPCTDDSDWEVFIPDDEDPLPEPGDFWFDDAGNDEFPKYD